jgi:two-component system chemotaxis response regulator CheY
MGLETYFNKPIMVADDLPNMRLDLIAILKSLGFTNIKETADGKAAWDELRVQAQYGDPYAIIFTDINMPRMNGLALLKVLRNSESYQKTPIFMVSTDNEKETILKAIIDGATDYIIKPYNSTTVKEKIQARLK